MNESRPASTEADLEALEALQADASELEQIEELLDRFNVFEAIGFIGQEVTHSRFLAFLLDPGQNHGLGDLFLRSFLLKCSESTDWDLQPQANGDGRLRQTTVHTEVYTGDGKIDILVLNESEGWAVIIENKIWTTEHSNQLEKYYRFVKKTYSSYQVRGIYLTPFVIPDSKDDEVPVDLSQIDFEELKRRFEQGRKHTEAETLRGRVNSKLRQMVKLNKTRTDYQEQLQRLIEEYNAGSLNIEIYVKALINIAQELDEEDQRAISEGLTEEELAVFDILTKPDISLTDKEKEEIKKIARELLDTL
jgi:PD-(D/E)XK nuclease superfamily/Domain of unknown function (DUF3387)